jgi:hypothetical protein
MEVEKAANLPPSQFVSICAQMVKECSVTYRFKCSDSGEQKQ